jgi:iron-sulfur cluster assembly accessory protein
MSYTMDFLPGSSVTEDDTVVDADGVTLVVDPKSLLFLYGLQLDYSAALIGGGFKFSNPNATSSCGCGTSFSA